MKYRQEDSPDGLECRGPQGPRGLKYPHAGPGSDGGQSRSARTARIEMLCGQASFVRSTGRGPQGPRGLKCYQRHCRSAAFFGRGPQGPRGLKCYEDYLRSVGVNRRGPQGPRGLKFRGGGGPLHRRCRGPQGPRGLKSDPLDRQGHRPQESRSARTARIEIFSSRAMTASGAVSRSARTARIEIPFGGFLSRRRPPSRSARTARIEMLHCLGCLMA